MATLKIIQIILTTVQCTNTDCSGIVQHTPNLSYGVKTKIQWNTLNRDALIGEIGILETEHQVIFLEVEEFCGFTVSSALTFFVAPTTVSMSLCTAVITKSYIQ